MLIKITFLITVLAYAFVAGQSFFYLVAMTNASKKMEATVYISTRQLIDSEMKKNFSVVYYILLVSIGFLTAFTSAEINKTLFTCSVFSLIMVIADIILSLKGNVPINKMINSWTVTNYPAEWSAYRSRWINIYRIRQVLSIAGFIVLLAALVFAF